MTILRRPISGVKEMGWEPLPMVMRPVLVSAVVSRVKVDYFSQVQPRVKNGSKLGGLRDSAVSFKTRPKATVCAVGWSLSKWIQ